MNLDDVKALIQDAWEDAEWRELGQLIDEDVAQCYDPTCDCHPIVVREVE